MSQTYKRALYYKSPTIKGDDVKEVQERLKWLGYYKGGIDGSFGPGCEDAVREFQRRNLMTADGSVGPSTWEVLFSSNAKSMLAYSKAIYYKSPVMVGDDIAIIQRRLRSLGFYNGEIDGSFGPACEEAVKEFQRKNNLDVDGSVGPSTWYEIFNSDARGATVYTRAIYYKSPVITGEDVKYVQSRLRKLGFYNGEIDGSFGPSCDMAVRNFQRANRMDIDGSVGPSTWRRLFSMAANGQYSYRRAIYYTIPTLKGDDVVDIQRKLNELGFYQGEIDGSFGPACDAAVREFQRLLTLEADGSVGPATWRALFSRQNLVVVYKRPIYYKSPVMVGEDVKHIQKRLKELGFYKGDIDGSFGPGCEQAVKEFQERSGLSVDGSVGPATWEKIFDETHYQVIKYTRAIYYKSPVMVGEDVKQIQRKLKSLGFYNGEIDGSFGPACKEATQEFQESRGLNIDGSVGPDTWNELFDESKDAGDNLGMSYTRPLYYKSPVITGEDVKYVQRKLKSLGFYNGEIDGSFGPACKEAVKSFQESHGLSIDGSVGPGTWREMFGGSGNSGIHVGPGFINASKVFIDAGHGGGDSGAVGNGLKEKNIALSIALKLGNILKEKGISVKYSRESDRYITLEGRARQANIWGADLFISIHANSGPSSASGTECFTHPTASGRTKELSRRVALSISQNLGLRNRGHKEADFAVLRLTDMSAILVETGFISNSNDANLLANRQDEYARAIANQIGVTQSHQSDPGLELIRELSDLASKYCEDNDLHGYNNINRCILDYLRYDRYNDIEWKATLGFLSGFVDYAKKQPIHDKLIKHVRYNNTENININGSAIDLPHLAATTLGYVKDDDNNITQNVIPSFWVGWGGDVATAMSNLMEYKQKNKDRKLENDESIAESYIIGSNEYSCSRIDIEADIDSIQLATSYNWERFDRSVEKYYCLGGSMSEKRKNVMIVKELNLPLLVSENQLSEKIKYKMTGDEGFGYMLGIAGFALKYKAKFDSKEPNNSEKDAVCRAFAKYIKYKI